MIKPIVFGDYDKLSDDICYLGTKLYLRLNVMLSNKFETKTGETIRNSYHKEYRYDNSKYNTKLISMKRSFDYYLTLDKTDTKAYVAIGLQDMILLRMKLNEVTSWFNDDTFAIKNKELIIYNRKPSVVIDGMLFGRYLQLDPVVITWENSGQQQQGVRFTLSDPNEYVDIAIDKFYGFMYVIQSIDLFTAAQNLINYLGRPEFGTNLVDFETNKYVSEVQSERNMNAINNREVSSVQKKRSFFDRMDNI